MGWTRSVGLGSAHVLNFETGSMALMARQAEVKRRLDDAGLVIAGSLQDGRHTTDATQHPSSSYGMTLKVLGTVVSLTLAFLL